MLIGIGTNLGGNSTILMLLYLWWSHTNAYNNRFSESRMILQQVQATFVHLMELIKDHKLQVDSEVPEVRKLDIRSKDIWLDTTRTNMGTHSSSKRSNPSQLDLLRQATQF